MKPIFTRKNFRILAFIVILAGFIFSGMAMSIYRILKGENVSEEVKISIGTACMVLGPWIWKLSSIFGG